MWKLVGGKMVWVPMAEMEGEGADGGGAGGGAEPAEADGGSDGSDDLPPDAGLQNKPSEEELDDWMSPEARKAWDYDPFSPAEQKKREDEKAAAAGNAEPEGGEKEEDEPGKVAKEPQGEEKENPEIAALRKQNEQLQEMMKSYQALMEKQTAGGEEAGGAEGKEADDPLKKVPAYQPFQIPPQIKEMLFSDDPEKLSQGLGMLMQGVAQITHMRVREEMSGLMDQRIAGTVDSKQRELTEKQKVEETQKSIKADWEKAYPDLATEDLRPLVAHVGGQVAKELGASEWNEKLRDAIAARVRKVLGRNEAPAGEESKGGAKPARKVPYSANGSGRAPAPNQPDKTQQDIADTLGL